MNGISLKKRVVSGVFWVGVTKLIGQVVSWAITVYVARILTPEDYGLMSMVVIFTGFVVLFNEFGLGAVIIQKKDISEDDISNIFWMVILINVALCLISVLSAPLVAAFFKEPRITNIIRITSLNFIFVSIGLMSFNLMARKMLFRKRALAQTIGNLSGAATTLVLAINGFGVWSLVFGIIVIAFVSNLLFVFFHPFKVRSSFHIYEVKGMVNFGIQVAAARLMFYIYSNADFLIVGKLLGKTLLGYYSLAFQFASIPLEKITSLIGQVAFPAFSEIQEDNELLEKYFLKIVRFMAFVTFPIFLGMFLVADDAVILFLTEKWAPMIIPLKILCIVSTLRSLSTMYAPLVVAKGKPGISMINQLILVSVLPLAFYIGSLYGLEGLSYSWLVVFPVLFLITTHRSLKVINLSVVKYFNELRHVFMGSVCMVFFVIFCQKAFLVNLILPVKISATCVIGVISYFCYFLIFNREIIGEIRGIFKR